MSCSLGTAQLEHLASEGYVVVAVDHTHEAQAVEFPGGRVARRALPPPSIEVSKQMIATRVQDTSFVLDKLEVLARGGNPDAEHRALPAELDWSLDLSRIGMFGHSGGGLTAGETMVSDRRIDAGADLDGSMAYSQPARDFGRAADEGLDRPFLLMSAGDHGAPSDPSWQQFLNHHRSWSLQLHLPAGEHSPTPYMVASSERVQRIVGKLARAREPRMFGAQEHRFRLGAPLTELEVADFERHHGAVLPADYRAFITRIGHGGPGRYGGTGPLYGLLPVTAWDEALVEEARPAVLKAAFPVEPGVEYSANWLADVGLAEDGEEWFPGAIALGHLGCGDMAVLVVTGSGRGRVVYTSWSNSVPVYTPYPDFVARYERWLDAALRGELRW